MALGDHILCVCIDTCDIICRNEKNQQQEQTENEKGATPNDEIWRCFQTTFGSAVSHHRRKDFTNEFLYLKEKFMGNYTTIHPTLRVLKGRRSP